MNKNAPILRINPQADILLLIYLYQITPRIWADSYL